MTTGKIVGAVVPASVVGAAAGASAVAHKKGMISGETWPYVWPWIVAAAFLALLLGVLFLGVRRRWLFPPLAGFLMQTVGSLLFVLEVWPSSPWTLLWWGLGAFGVTLGVLLGLWIYSAIRAFLIERRMREGWGVQGDGEEIPLIRKRMGEALDRFKRAGGGKNALYELPWYLVIGRSAAGKTVAIRNSGLNLPVKDRQKGMGGNYTCEYIFTTDMIFLDTPGKWVMEGVSEEGRQVWGEFLKQIRKVRGRRPLDGIVVVVPADDLLSKTDEELQEQAANIREVIDLIHAELKFRFPVYLLVSKCDLVDGFVDYFRGLPAQRWHELFGWSNPDPNRGDPRKLIPQGFRRVMQRLEAYRLEMLARIAGATKARNLFFFTENFKRIERPLTVVADVLFFGDPEAPIFRGFYFTSGTQGEGTPIGDAMNQLARNLGLRLPTPSGQENEPKRSFFLLEMFRELMVGDEGLVDRTARHWLKRRRDTVFAAFLPAGIAAALLVLSVFSWSCNTRVFRDGARTITEVERAIREIPADGAGENILKVLRETQKLRDLHEDISRFHLFRSLGMRRPGELDVELLQTFRTHLQEGVLDPTLAGAAALASDASGDCALQVDLLRSTVKLLKSRYDGSELDGFQNVWKLSDRAGEEAQDLLLDQFSYLRDTVRREQKRGGLISGFSIAEVARSVEEACKSQSAGSAFDAYIGFQEQCGGLLDDGQKINACFTRLRSAVERDEGSGVDLTESLDELADDLADLEDEVDGARGAAIAVSKLRGVDRSGKGKCFQQFETDVFKPIREYVRSQQPMYEMCRNDYKSLQIDSLQVNARLSEQAEKLKGPEEAIVAAMQKFASSCGNELPGASGLDAGALRSVTASYRAFYCLGQLGAPTVARKASGPRPPSGGGARPSGGGAKPSLTLLAAPALPPAELQVAQWLEKKRQWSANLAAAEQLQPALRSSAREATLSEVRSYADRYAGAWSEYLRRLSVRPPGAPIPAWLQSLSTSTEWIEALQPAAQAMATGDPSDPAAAVMAQKLGPLASLPAFVDGKLGEYQSELRKVAVGLERFDAEGESGGDFKEAVRRLDPNNSLVAARTWVDVNASTVAGGALAKFLRVPLERAEEYVKSKKFDVNRWAAMSTHWDEVGGLFPFAKSADSLASADAARAVFAQDVPLLREQQDQLGLSRGAREWLDRASSVSAALFTDARTPRTMSLNLSLPADGISYSEKDLKKDYKITGINLMLEGAEKSWDIATKNTETVAIPLLGTEAADLQSASISVTLKRGKEPLMPIEMESERGLWAPIRLIDKGLAGGRVTDDQAELVFVARVMGKKGKEEGTITFKIRASGRGLGAVIDLLRTGMGRPPVDPTRQ